MKRAMLLLSAVAILAIAAGDGWATTYNYEFEPQNYYNAAGYYPNIPNDSPGTYYSTLPTGPTATEDGLVWLKTGSTPALFAQNLAVSVYYENANSAWYLEETEFCSYAQSGYAGYFFAASAGEEYGLARLINDPLIVGSETIPAEGAPGNPLTTYEQGSFYLQFWTDPELASTGTSAYGTYAQANAASAAGASGVYVAQTVPFLVDFDSWAQGGFPSGLNYPNIIGMYMPAVVLEKGVATPEPSTVALALAGLLGLAAYAWRRRK